MFRFYILQALRKNYARWIREELPTIEWRACLSAEYWGPRPPGRLNHSATSKELL
jgi:hypothetical protein